MPANILDCEPEKVTVGMPVELSIQERAGQKLVAFRSPNPL